MKTEAKRIVFAMIIILYIIFPDITCAETAKSRKMAHQAVAENDLTLAIAMYSELIKDYDMNAPEKDQKEFVNDFRKGYEICMAENRFLEALEFATFGLKAAQKGEDKVSEITFLGSIGNIHMIFNDFERASYYYKRGYNLALEYDMPDFQWKFLLSLVPSNIRSGDISQAKEYFRKLKLASESDSLMSAFHNEYLQGLIASADSIPSAARYYHRRALAIAEENRMFEYMVNELWEIGNSFYDDRNIDSAQHYYNAALDKALKTGMNAHLPKIYISLAQVAQLTGDSAAYSRYTRLMKEASDNYFSNRKFNSKRNQLLEYEESIKDTSIANLDKEVKIQKLIAIGTGIILLIVTVFYILLRKRIKALRYANNKLIDKNRELIKVQEQNLKLIDMKLASELNSYTTADKQNDTDSETTEDNQAINDSQEPMKEARLSKEQADILLNRIHKIMYDSENPYNSGFSLSSLAQMVRSNTKYVSWVINETYGMSFKSLLTELRIRKASKMLEDHKNYGKHTIQAIYEEVGYKSPTSFAAAFNRIIGMTPSVYRKLAKERIEILSTAAD